MLDADLYIACIRLTGKPCLVVGEGPPAREKAAGLRACEADVAVVAPEAFEPSALDGRFLVIAATSDAELNALVYREAEARRMLVNVVDVPELCNFILPAIHRQGHIAVAITTSGASPALAVRMKKEIAARYGVHHARFAELLDGLRAWAKQNLPTYNDRKEFFEAIVNADPDPIALLETGDEGAVRRLIERLKPAPG